MGCGSSSSKTEINVEEKGEYQVEYQEEEKEEDIKVEEEVEFDNLEVLRSEFASWDDDHLNEVMVANNNNGRAAAQLIRSWTNMKATPSVTHLLAESPQHETQVIDRALYDRVIADKMRRKQSPADFAEKTLSVLLRMKSKAKNSRLRVQKQHMQINQDGLGLDDFNFNLSRVKTVDQSLLDQRMAFLNMRSLQIRGDGNCQFRSFSQELFGTQDQHAHVREVAVAHIMEFSDSYSIYFDGDGSFGEWLGKMSEHGTWGDELTLRALADAYRVKVHVITTNKDNWYLEYEPDTSIPCHEMVMQAKGEQVRHVFLCYVSPVHYNVPVANK